MVCVPCAGSRGPREAGLGGGSWGTSVLKCEWGEPGGQGVWKEDRVTQTDTEAQSGHIFLEQWQVRGCDYRA